ncbi:MAG: bacteriohopanetetrol glucosamine biosynthesis glycosyltransferase HpnI [Chloroflexi bacterium]|nr:bacteriohopanetetrol glucosamine biosynthesis glycosyltransferase HpnI [Chloroflexota bacterium]
MVVVIVLEVLTIASWAYWLIAMVWTREYFSSPDTFPTFTPPISILKPVKGVDAQAYQNFASFCNQDYPDYEVVFGVAEQDDPVISVIESLKRNYPNRQIRLIIAPTVMVNRKSSLLEALSRQAKNEILVFSDSDMRVTPDFLRRVVAPLSDETIGLVTCPYRGEAPVTMTARLEGLYMGVTFLPSVLVARRFLNMRFSMGAASVIRKRDLAGIGGFAAVADYLADDYQIGMRIGKLGKRVYLSKYVVVSVLGATTFRDQWLREVRWAHCNRLSRPKEYPGLLISYSTPLSVVLFLASGLSLLGLFAVGISITLRWVIAWVVSGTTGDHLTRRYLYLLPLRDMLTALIWCAGLVGRTVEWRGVRYVVLAEGRLRPMASVETPYIIRLGIEILSWPIRAIDAVLRRVYGIYEFSKSEECILRLSVTKNRRMVNLSDGILISPGEPVAVIHLWNERMPRLESDTSDLSWGRSFFHRLIISFEELAEYAEMDPDGQRLVAYFGDNIFAYHQNLAQRVDFFRKWGFDLIEIPAKPDSLWKEFAEFWEDLYNAALILAFNPNSLEGKTLRKGQTGQLWISRERLIYLYGRRKNLPLDTARIDTDQLSLQNN